MRVVLIIVIFLFMPILACFAEEKASFVEINQYSSVTSEPQIEQALDDMDGTTGEWAKKAILGDNLSGKPIKVSFKDLSQLSKAYKNFDALGWKENGQLFIFINQKHKNAPPEALACLLSHEAVHQDDISSLEEETYAWGYEADVWVQMKNRKKSLEKLDPKTYSLVDRMDTLEKLYRKAEFTTKLIKQSVYSNPGYQGLPVTSPGFGK